MSKEESNENSADSIEGSLEKLLSEHQEQEEITLNDIRETFRERGYGPLLCVPALIAGSPVGMIPFLPTTFGCILLLISLQLVLGKSSPWLPKSLASYGFSRERMEKSLDKVRRYLRFADSFFKRRFHWIISGQAARIWGGVCSILALAMPPLEWIPGAASIPAMGIALIGAAMLAEDGLMVLIAMVLVGACSCGLYFLFL